VTRRYVYVAVWGDYVKIGVSENPPKRVAAFSRALLPEGVARPDGRPELIGYVDGSVGAECLLHAALRDYAMGREWYRRGPAVDAVVERARSWYFEVWHGPLPHWRLPVPKLAPSVDF
jgi:hypothetical protein